MFTIAHSLYAGSTVADGTQGAAQFGSSVSREVYGWYAGVGGGAASAVASKVESGNDNQLRVVSSRVLLVPDASPYSPRDKIVFPGETVPFFVSKDVRDYNTGPYGYNPGGEVVVEKTSG